MQLRMPPRTPQFVAPHNLRNPLDLAAMLRCMPNHLCLTAHYCTLRYSRSCVTTTPLGVMIGLANRRIVGAALAQRAGSRQAVQWAASSFCSGGGGAVTSVPAGSTRSSLVSRGKLAAWSADKAHDRRILDLEANALLLLLLRSAAARRLVPGRAILHLLVVCARSTPRLFAGNPWLTR